MPQLDDPLTERFWTGTRENKLVVQRCDNCEHLRWPPAPICPECLTSGGTWTEVEAQGRVWSYCTYQKQLHAPYEWPLPYTVALIELDAGLVMTGMLTNSIEQPSVGRRVVVVYEKATEAVTFVRWRFA